MKIGVSAGGMTNSIVMNAPSRMVPSDTTPDAFSFTDVTGSALSSTITSNAITVAGITASATITVTGGEYRINDGAYTSDAGTVSVDDTVNARLTSSGSNSTAVNCTVTIGGVADTFTSTTLAAATRVDNHLTTTYNTAGPSAGYTGVDRDFSLPAGSVTHFIIFNGSSVTMTNVRFTVWRGAAPGTTFVGKSQLVASVAVTADTEKQIAIDTPFDVQAGDYIGIYMGGTPGTMYSASAGANGGVNWYFGDSVATEASDENPQSASAIAIGCVVQE
jgi:hypothetical protein